MTKQENGSSPADDLELFPRLEDLPPEWIGNIVDETPAPAAEEAEEEPEEEIEPSPFAKKVAGIPEKKWRTYQIIGGVVLGLLAGLAITLFSHISEQYSSFGLIAAAVIALIVPSQLEKRAERKIPALRIAMIVAIAATMGAYMLYGASTGMFQSE
ncbi:hypothetical protein LJC07_02055 [Christensenellaceae bacterium OttesenSCG-928-L17]|nr:hypothetical protein [Christensenellaceae bacterium OttesenSCG-928-L17]